MLGEELFVAPSFEFGQGGPERLSFGRELVADAQGRALVDFSGEQAGCGEFAEAFGEHALAHGG